MEEVALRPDARRFVTVLPFVPTVELNARRTTELTFAPTAPNVGLNVRLADKLALAIGLAAEVNSRPAIT
ncbi:hypothetical protein CKO42_05950 [Lamprobacter modestohalophilus]|uniref:Uncharacterized protein n=1 Tax=Lamprobacter modestohalophilus TaxID=1064514 RepID=A0A9X1B3U2_9GAMM|nr:hypothetical protein [Lamprobacter modestohalophilus]MBK1618001.1 hypothetical protein [Lamprobacter modestohalophilus]